MLEPVDRPSPLGPPQFGLRTLLLVVSSLAVLLGLSQWLSPITLAAVILLVLSIVAHIAGNVIGTRLRAGRHAKSLAKIDPPDHAAISLRDDHFAPVSKLGRQHSLGWLPLVSAIVGLAIGALIGGVWTAILLHPSFDLFTIAIAAVAFGALGSFGGFLIVGFAKAGWDAWHEAATHSTAVHDGEQKPTE
ncbi:hypothetical protein ETAA8_48990 [Anatilimnocola aggregata]|uniref:Uncharacterized protein n=1 Tax=Anatilimnocola aggregata TaxID=2528021 RepID=A0A517YHV2_9BACT|nr:hypothetical protein [Anatilimnocola aggregata]QDU29784.1 hypothetical protein ETAA8_48990 [Anatilimnocola aggregata]